MAGQIEPLPPDLWFERVEMIANGELRSTENALRHAFHLHQLAPLEFRIGEQAAIDEDSFEALLESGDLDAAARRLVSNTALTVSTTSTGDGVEVALGCRSLKRTIRGKGNSVATAILQAWTRCVFAVRAELNPGCLDQASEE